ncbi:MULTISPECIES: hypothetical protein [unclassified Streptomyces]|nr:hypothetical protein [Streptomyces sp. 13-12-16]
MREHPAEHEALITRLRANDVRGFSDILRSRVGDMYGSDVRHLHF